MEQVQILIVEDESIVALDIKGTLERLGYAVSGVASSGEEAISKAVETRPHLVLMDIKLRGAMDGVEAAERVRDNLDVPVIFLTAFSDEKTLGRAISTQPFGYLLKPFEGRELRTAIEMALFKRKMERKIEESEQWLATTLKSIGDGLIATDAQGCIKFMNQVAEALTGWKQDEALGEELEEVLVLADAQTRASLEKPLERVLQKGVGSEFAKHTLLVARDGTATPVHGSWAAITPDPGGNAGMVLVFRDISQQVQAEEEIRSRNRELALLNRIIAASAAGLETEAVLETACRELALALGAPKASATLLGEKGMTAALVAEYLTNGQPSRLNRTFSVAEHPWLQRMLTQKTPFVMEDHGSRLVLPLMIEGDTVGSLSLKTLEPHSFSAEEVGLAWRVAGQVAGTLERARLNAERQRLSKAIQQAGESVIITDAQGAIVYVNPAFERITGYQRAEVLGRNPSLLKSGEHRGDFYQELWATITAGQVWQGRFVNRRKDGSLYTADTTIAPVCDESNGIVNYISLQRDVTRELQLKEQYHQVQKMKALGQLTAGIAHDFNNLLNIINGYAELVQLRLSPDNTVQQPLENIRTAGRRAAELVNQLLAFSSKQATQPQDLDLNSVVAEMSQMLERIVGEHIEMETKLAPDLRLVEADPTQIEQVIVNLVVNARDAMPQGGHLIIETANVVLDGEYVADHLGMWPGNYVQMTVSDTGMGMSEVVKSRIFEPFFTTKEFGEGTGLGLSTVHGIVEQSEGHIWVYSEEGCGTTFKIYLPSAAEVISDCESSKAKAVLPSGRETILLVEDDLGVRELARSILQAQGYTVLPAQDGGEALQLSASHPEDIQLLLTDLMMPRMKGMDLAGELARTQPGMRVVFMSGYSDEVAVQNGVLKPGATLLQKPFGSTALACKVRDALDS
jgi:PAS domain S-box-containing protein